MWGVWITAHARYNILWIIHEMDPDLTTNNVIYSDTDSVYFIDSPRCRKIIEEWNARIREQNKALPAYMDTLGCFDWIDEDDQGEPIRYRFKTLGAKRYVKVYEKDGCTQCEVTVAGMRKGSLQRKISTEFASAPDSFAWQPDKHDPHKRWISEAELFDSFEPYQLLTMNESLKNTAIYDPEPYSETVTDAAGHTETMSELSGVAIVPITFRVNMEWTYLNLIFNELKARRRPIWE